METARDEESDLRRPLAADAGGDQGHQQEGCGVLSALRRLSPTLPPVNWCKVLDAFILLLHAIGFFCSAWLLTTSTASTCKASSSDAAAVGFAVALQMAPMVSTCIVLYSTRFHWEDTGAPQPACLPVVHILCGIAISVWLSVCLVGTPEVVSVIVGFFVACLTILLTRRVEEQ